MSAHTDPEDVPEDDAAMLDPAEAGEEIPSDEDEPMDSDGGDDNDASAEALEEITLQNDSVAHFDAHKDSIFCIARHPVHQGIVATGGGDDVGYIFDATPPELPVLPASYQNTSPAGGVAERESIKPLYKLEGHTDSLNAIAFTLPRGEYVVSAGLDGRLRAWQGDAATGTQWKFVAEAQEVEEINWLAPCPHPDFPNTIALGASDGSVWVYTVNAADSASPLTIVQAFYSHTASCTAGAWTPDGKLLATVSEDESLYVWDVFGEAAAASVTGTAGSQSVIGLTAQDERFRVEGGLYSVGIPPTGAFVAVGGTEGQIRVVGLPRISSPSANSSSSKTSKPSKSRPAASSSSTATTTQSGAILAALTAGSDSVESITFPPTTPASPQNPVLMAAANVDGTITLFDTSRRFAVRRSIPQSHIDDSTGEPQAVIKLEFGVGLPPSTTNSASGPSSTPGAAAAAASWLLTSAGNDGVLKRWDTRGPSTAGAPSNPASGDTGAKNQVAALRGHRGGGDGGGILGFVLGASEKAGNWAVTAGDDGVALVFRMPSLSA